MIQKEYSNDLLCSLFVQKDDCLDSGPVVYKTTRSEFNRLRKEKKCEQLQIKKAEKVQEKQRKRQQGNYRKKRKPDDCELLGIYIHHGKYNAYVTINSRKIHLGTYDQEELAFLIRQAFLIDLYGEQALQFEYKNTNT